MNFNDSFEHFLDMNCYDSASGYKSVAFEPTPAPSHSVATEGGGRVSSRPMGQKTVETSIEHTVAPSMAGHLHNTCPLRKQGVTCTHTSVMSHKEHMGADQYLTQSEPSSASSVPWLAPLVMLNSTFTLWFSLKTLPKT